MAGAECLKGKVVERDSEKYWLGLQIRKCSVDRLL